MRFICTNLQVLCLYNRDENSSEAECTVHVIEVVAHYACSLSPEEVISNLKLWVRNHLKEWDTLDGISAWVDAQTVAGGTSEGPSAGGGSSSAAADADTPLAPDDNAASDETEVLKCYLLNTRHC